MSESLEVRRVKDALTARIAYHRERADQLEALVSDIPAKLSAPAALALLDLLASKAAT